MTLHGGILLTLLSVVATGDPEPEPALPLCYPQFPCAEIAHDVAQQLAEFAEGLKGIADGLEQDEGCNVDPSPDGFADDPEILRLLRDADIWRLVATLQRPKPAERRAARRRLLEMIGESAFRRGELPAMAPWAE